MSKSKRKKSHYMDDGVMGVYDKIRKPMPKPTKVMRNKRDEDNDSKWSRKDWER
jgi:hypothetical protein